MTDKAEQTVLGLPIVNPGPDGIPLDAIVLAKYMDADGEPSHRIMFTDDLEVIDVFGRLRYAQLIVENGLLVTMAGEDDDE